MYKTILEEASYEEEVKKSRFIAYISPVSSKEEAETYIAEIKERHKDATHNCSAYIIGKEGLIQKYDDDGEPQKTAGPPILDVLKNNKLKDVVCVVTRYFGGIMLGAGGLIRAYSKTASGALTRAQIVNMEGMKKIRISYDYVFHGSIENFLLTGGFPIIEAEFTDKVSLTSLVFSDTEEYFLNNISDKTSGSQLVLYNEEIVLPSIEGKLLWEGKIYHQERWAKGGLE